ncbi:MAG: hypothetical protein ACXADH_06425 [Candidatus Kariarchaeaceae archaeon]
MKYLEMKEEERKGFREPNNVILKGLRELSIELGEYKTSGP